MLMSGNEGYSCDVSHLEVYARNGDPVCFEWGQSVDWGVGVS